MDAHIQETVESLLGAGVEVLDCEKKSSIREEESLLVNGRPLHLEGEDAAAVRQALIAGNVPSADLLNQILVRAGIIRAPVQLETSLSVKSSVVTREEVTIARGGQVVDERSRETKEDNFYTSLTNEVWEPVAILPKKTAEAVVAANKAATSASCANGAKLPFSANGSPFSSSSSSGFWSPGGATDSEFFSQQDETDHSLGMFSKKCNVGDIAVNGRYTRLPDSTRHPPQPHYPTQSRSPSSSSGSRSSRPSSDTSSTGNGTCSVDEVDRAHPGHHRSEAERVIREGLHRLSLGCNPVDKELITSAVSPVAILESAANNANQLIFQQPKTAAASQAKNSSNVHPGAGSYANGGQTEPHSDSGSALVYTDGVLVSGSLEALVLHMVPTADYYPDRAFLFAFLLSSRLFIRPHELLGEVCALAEAQQRLAEMQGLPKDRCQRYVQHLVQLLREWTESFPYDFRDEAVMAHVRDLTQRLVAGTAAGCGAGADPAIRKEVSALLQELLHRLTTLENYEALLARYGAGATSGATTGASQAADGAGAANSVDNLTVADVTELAASPLALARQLTHIELERLSYIGPEEFVQAFAKEHPGVDPNCKEAKKTRNLELYVAWFNRLSYLVATEVCKHQKKKHRVRVMEFWIEAARECFNIGNFNSLMAIIAGLNMAPVSRLKKTWNKVQSAKFSILEHQMDPTCNFSSYRSTLKAAVWRSAGSGSGGGGGGGSGGCTQPAAAAERIVVPFFSLLVKDLYFLNEGCSNRLPNGHINFEKFWQVAKQVTEFMAWKQVECPFEKNTNVILFLQASPVLSESALALASFDCEAPDGANEKEHYKTLKAELNAANNS